MTAAVAQLMQPVLDDVLSGNNKDLIIPIAAALFGAFTLRGATTYVHTLLMVKIGQSIIADIQNHLFKHMMSLDLKFFHENSSGQLISRVINDVDIVRMAMSDALTAFGKSTLTLIFLIAVMFYQDWKLSIAAFTVFPFAALFVMYLGKKLRKVSGSIQLNKADLSDRLSQIFQGIRQVKAYGTAQHEAVRAGQAIEKVKKLNVKSVQIGNLSTPVNEILVGIVIFGVVVYGGFQIAEGNMSTGQLISFIMAFSLAYEPMKKLARLNNTLQLGLGATERVFEILDIQPKIKDSANAKALKEKKINIIFKNIDFSYEETEANALNNICFSAEAGKVTALVGESGSGKSTIINLIPRFYDIKTGDIIIGDKPIKDIKVSSLRSNISLVSQDITIFDDTIANNIAYGLSGITKKKITQAQIEKAAKAAAAHDFICGFPKGYKTKVGEDGVKLSGGQRQRLSIARAMLRDAPILLLDEATSALDNESEKAVQKALQRLEKGRTTIVIAHRLSTVRKAHQILVLDKGKIIEQGTHDALLKKNGHYARMYKLGLKD